MTQKQLADELAVEAQLLREENQNLYPEDAEASDFEQTYPEDRI